jgi:hypothetical protein
MRPIALREDAPVEHRRLRPFHRFRGPRIAGPSSAPSKDYWAASHPSPLHRAAYEAAFIASPSSPRLATTAIVDPAAVQFGAPPLPADLSHSRTAVAVAARSLPPSIPRLVRSIVPPAAISARRPSRRHLRPLPSPPLVPLAAIRPPRSSGLRDRRRPLPPSAAIIGVASVSDNAAASLPISLLPRRWRQLWPRVITGHSS